MKKQTFEIDMTTGAIMPKLISFCLPLMLSGMLQLLFNAVDIVVVGRFTGREALAAVGATSSLIHMSTNLFIGISLGTNVLCARFYAAEKYEEMSEAVHTSILTAIIFGIIMVFVGFLFSRFALTIMGTPDDVIDASTLYMKIYFCGMPFFMLYNYGAAVLRAVGNTRNPLIYLSIAGTINACVNLLLVIVFKMGVSGVAIATVLSQFISCILVLRCLVRSDGPYKLDFRKLHINPKHLLSMCQIGIPAGLQSTIINFSNALLQSSVNSFGSIAMAGYTSVNNLFGFMYISVNSITQGCMSFTSQNYGARKPERIHQVLLNTMIIEVITALLLGIGFYLSGPVLLQLYSSDQQVIAAGMEVLKISCILYFLCAIMDSFPGFLRGLGRSTVPMFLSVIGTVGFRVIWITQFFPHHRTLFYLFICYPGSWLVTVLMQFTYYIRIRDKVYAELR